MMAFNFGKTFSTAFTIKSICRLKTASTSINPRGLYQHLSSAPGYGLFYQTENIFNHVEPVGIALSCVRGEVVK